MADEQPHLPRPLGPYRLVELLGHGGMAEVYRARRDGPGGFVKDVAVKLILPQYAKNEQLVHRFMEEARIAGALIHGNIVQIYDFGYFDGQYYLAMEYIDGLSLARVLDICVESRIPLPTPLVAFIGAEVASGLAYAHGLTDPNGQQIHVVHRDVSPQNIMLSYAGDVKVGDFGIVKAADSLIQTEAGMRLGKVSYMSPEQASGTKLDGRSDMFALGVTLWEALTLRPLLPRDQAVKAIEMLGTCNFAPPRAYARDVPPELEEIVMHALSRDREARYADCEAMARGLRAFVHTYAPGFGRHDLVEYLEWLDPEGGRPSGVGPPVPPPAPMSSLRSGRGAQGRKRGSPLPWIALAAAPFLGLGCGVAAFAGLSLLFDEAAEVSSPVVNVPAATSTTPIAPQVPVISQTQPVAPIVPPGVGPQLVQPGVAQQPAIASQGGAVGIAPPPPPPAFTPRPEPDREPTPQAPRPELPNPFFDLVPSTSHPDVGPAPSSRRQTTSSRRREAAGSSRENKPNRDAGASRRRGEK
jgi:eukaryotic-like serine/threonine-protein kinase